MNTNWSKVVLPILQGLAGGTLLYVTVSEVLPRERAKWHKSSRRYAGVLQFFSVGAGFVLIFLLNRYVGEWIDCWILQIIRGIQVRRVNRNYAKSSFPRFVRCWLHPAYVNTVVWYILEQVLQTAKFTANEMFTISLGKFLKILYRMFTSYIAVYFTLIWF